MPWTPTRYPPAMRRLPPLVRLKAIEIANALLDEEYDEGRAIRIGIAKAKEWASRHANELTMLRQPGVWSEPGFDP
jgi:uncharacterized protein YdaT